MVSKLLLGWRLITLSIGYDVPITSELGLRLAKPKILQLNHRFT